MIERLNLKEVAALLKRKTTRGAEAWCRRAGVPVFTDAGGTRYAIKLHVVQAHLRGFIQTLKEQHGARWVEAFQAHMQNDMQGLTLLDKTDASTRASKTDVPPNAGSHEHRFLSTLTEPLNSQ